MAPIKYRRHSPEEPPCSGGLGRRTRVHACQVDRVARALIARPPGAVASALFALAVARNCATRAHAPARACARARVGTCDSSVGARRLGWGAKAAFRATAAAVERTTCARTSDTRELGALQCMGNLTDCLQHLVCRRHAPVTQGVQGRERAVSCLVHSTGFTGGADAGTGAGSAFDRYGTLRWLCEDRLCCDGDTAGSVLDTSGLAGPAAISLDEVHAECFRI